MFNFILGWIGYKKDPVATGVMYLRQKFREYGGDPDALPNNFWIELAKDSHNFVEFMAELERNRSLPKESVITKYVNTLDMVLCCLLNAKDGLNEKTPEDIYKIFEKYDLKSKNFLYQPYE